MLPQSAESPTPQVPPPSREERLRRLAEDGQRARAEVARVLSRARSRALLLATGRGLSLFAGALCLSLALAAPVSAVASVTLSRALGAALLALTLGLMWLFTRRSRLQRAASGRDPRALAAFLAAVGGRELLTSVELDRDPPQGASPELLSLVHQRAADKARTLDLRRALPARTLRPPLLALLGCVLVVVLVRLAAPQRFQLGLKRLVQGEDAAPPQEAEPIAGDLTVTYVYPPYTGLPPRVEEGTAGDLRGPKGTEVRLTARADRDVTQAFAVVNGAAQKLETGGPGGRSLSGALTLTQPGRWRLRYTDAKGRTVAEGPDRPIELVADTVPQVTIEEPQKAEIEVDPQGKLPVSWSAQDDYGLTEVSLVFQRPGEKEERIPLQPRNLDSATARRLRGTYGWELSTLRLRAGDRVSFHVEAKDNDAVDGPQRGVSSTRVLKVFSAAEHHREALLKAQQLWERLVAHLADRLEAPPPPAENAKEWFDAQTAKDKNGQQLVGELIKVSRELQKDKLAPQAVARALRYVGSGLSPVVARTTSARAPLVHGARTHEGASRIFTQALQREVAELEKGVLYLADLLDQARVADLAELQKELAQSRRELSRLAEKLRKAPDEATRKAVLAEVQRLRERVQELMERMSEMAEGVRDEHLNREAVEAAQKEKDLMGQLSDVQRKLQDGKIDDALSQLDKLGQQLEQLEKNLQKQAQQRGGEQYAEEAKQLKEAAQKLSELKEREQKLEQRTAELRRASRKRAEEKFQKAGGKELVKKLREKVEQARKSLSQVDPKVADGLGMEEQLDAANERVQDTGRALEAQDFEEALEQATRATRALEGLQARLQYEEQLGLRTPGFQRDPVGQHKALQESKNAQKTMDEVARALAEALPREGEGMSAQERRELQSQQQEQGQLQQGLQKVRDQLGEVGKKVPIFGPQHEQLLQQAQGAMQQASDRLGRGEPRGAQAQEQMAGERLEKFEQAMKELAQQGGGSGGGMPMPWGDPQGQGDEGEGDGDGMRKERVEIPDAESKGPQEFRKRLLDAMKQQAPEKYKERVKGYYEELVK